MRSAKNQGQVCDVVAVAATRVMQRCDILATLSASPSFIERTYLSPAHAQANDMVQGWMREAEMSTWQDAVGNIWGRYASRDTSAPTLIVGSHLDSIVNAGKYDGILGVLLGIELCDLLAASGTDLPFNLDVVGFCDEEGVRFGATLLGSLAISGKWQDSWAELTDTDGVSLAQAMQNFGLSISQASTAALNPESVRGFLEVHIEQGPVLESRDLPVGVVTDISGARRFSLVVEGKAGHAGTVPMSMRKDALLGASQCIALVEEATKRFNVLATVGDIACAPGAANVIPGSVHFLLDIRSAKDRLRDRALDWLMAAMRSQCRKRGLSIDNIEIHSANAAACDSRWQRLFEHAMRDAGIEVNSLASGAGHDAMAMTGFTPMGMLFVRCKEGISHHPDESITTNDAAVALDVLTRAVCADAGVAAPI